MEEKVEGTGFTTRQKITAGVVVVVFGVIIWQIIGMFSSSSDEVKKTAVVPKPASPVTTQKPTPSKIPETPIDPAIQSELTKMEQEAQARYVRAINDLQMLKVTQQIVDTTKAIAEAKTATVKAQKEIVDMLTPKTAPKEAETGVIVGAPSGATNTGNQNSLFMAPNNISVSQAVDATGAPTTDGNIPSAQSEQNTAPKEPPKPEIANYSVVSVTELMGKWNAVLSYRGKLFSVAVGDVLPEDNSTVININKSSITLEKQGYQKRISLVPII